MGAREKRGVNLHLSRRAMLGLMGIVGVAALSGCGPNTSVPQRLRRLWSRKSTVTAMPPCIVRPEQTEGPYFVDERLDRSDLRVDPSDGTMKEGLPLELALRVYEIRDKDCIPFAGAMVDVWHCDALGVYSDVRDRSFDTRGKKFLRGYQTTDDSGTARFITIYPGWYSGRAVHIHFKVRTSPKSQRGYEFISQIYFDDMLTDKIQTQPPYAVKGKNRLRNQEDGIFQDGGEALILKPTLQANGYTGTFDIGLLLG